jgi:hypothetical protein
MWRDKILRAMKNKPNQTKKPVADNSPDAEILEKFINSPYLGLVKIIFDLLVIIVAMVAIFVSCSANKIAREALQSSTTPWLKVTTFSVATNFSQIEFSVENYSDYPALNLQTSVSFVGETSGAAENRNIPKQKESDSIMPHDTPRFPRYITGYEWGKVVEQLRDGKTKLQFHLKYEGVGHEEVEIDQEMGFMKGVVPPQAQNLLYNVHRRGNGK